MKIPDKIYIEIRHPFRNEFTEMVGFENKGNSEDIEYIRKDALLEWAKGLKERWEEPPMSKHSPGCVYMLEQLIDKLNSM